MMRCLLHAQVSVMTFALLAVIVVTATRETVSFDFDWKHRTGLKEVAQWDDPPPAQVDPGLHPPEARSLDTMALTGGTFNFPTMD